MTDRPSIVDVVLAPARLVVDALAALPRIADGLDRLQGLDQLADTVERLERAAEELTQAVQPLHGVAQRINRFGRRGASEVGGSG